MKLFFLKGQLSLGTQLFIASALIRLILALIILIVLWLFVLWSSILA